MLTKAFKFAETNAYLDTVRKIQNQVPKTTCNCCGSCCRDTPDAYFIEFLLFLKEFDKMPKERMKNIILKTLDWSLLSLQEVGIECPLLENLSFNV